jgi:hypothetical protein
MSLQETVGLPPLVALHRYWMHTNRMRRHFETVLSAKRPKSLKASGKLTKDEIHDLMMEAFLYVTDDRGMFMSYWYGTPYVVIEGWKQLRLSDTRIDQLLKSPNVRLLKLYRNGVYHFQKNYFDNRFAGFMKSKDSVTWVSELHEEFGRFFLEESARRLAAEKQDQSAASEKSRPGN